MNKSLLLLFFRKEDARFLGFRDIGSDVLWWCGVYAT
jgi:hypothetical protein